MVFEFVHGKLHAEAGVHAVADGVGHIFEGDGPGAILIVFPKCVVFRIFGRANTSGVSDTPDGGLRFVEEVSGLQFGIEFVVL